MHIKYNGLKALTYNASFSVFKYNFFEHPKKINLTGDYLQFPFESHFQTLGTKVIKVTFSEEFYDVIDVPVDKNFSFYFQTPQEANRTIVIPFKDFEEIITGNLTFESIGAESYKTEMDLILNPKQDIIKDFKEEIWDFIMGNKYVVILLIILFVAFIIFLKT